MSVNQAMAKKPGRAKREREPTWLRATTRRSILDAARELIARDGPEKASLVRVAEKAGFAAPTVYAYFVRKADLLTAILAEDLASFARGLAEQFQFSEEAGDEGGDAPVAAPPGEAQPSPGDENAASVSGTSEEAPTAPFEAEAAEIAAEPAPPAALAPVREPDDATPAPSETIRDDQASAAGATLAEAVEEHDPVAAPEGQGVCEPVAAIRSVPPDLSALEERLTQLEARRVDPWLERRLREFERMVSALEEKTGQIEHAQAAASAPLEVRLEELAGRFAALEKKRAGDVEAQAKSVAEKLEAGDARQRQSWTELRTLVLETSGRLEVLERDRELRALAAEMPAIAVADKAAPAEPRETADAAAEDAEESYLAAARRAAQAAESLARSEADAVRSSWGAWLGRTPTRMLLVLFVGVGLVVTGAGVALKDRMSAVSGTPASVVRATPVIFAMAAPRLLGADESRRDLAGGLAALAANESERAARQLTLAAVAGQPIAQYWLATLYEHGRGVPADAAQALRWYEAAALQGNLRAMYKLAVSYAEGWGARRNYGEAARWFSRAAEFGFVNAQYNLAVLYERGLGVPQSLLDAYKWYALAAAQGDKVSAARVDALASQLSPEDLASARDAVAAFKPEATDSAANADAPQAAVTRVKG